MGTESNRSPYKGKDRRLVIAIDVGTTFTAASFCILQPGKVPKFEEVLRWPKQATPDAKIPSVIYYDLRGQPKAHGSETDDEEIVMNAELEGWLRTEWFKLHLRPSHLPMIPNLRLQPLTRGLTVDDVFAHFLKYIRIQLEAYISNQYGAGANIWASLSPTMFVVLTTPNGWEGKQQNRMRIAAIKAGLVDEDGGRRVRFVSEAEAAVLYAVDSGCIGDWLTEDGNLILCDCGGGTIDVTDYKITQTSPFKLEETAASRCYLAGAVFVTSAARDYLQNMLRETEWDNPDALNHAVNNFERNAKRKFDNPEAPSWVELGGFKTVPAKGIVRGRMKIPGETMADFFSKSIANIKQGLDIAFENGQQLADKVILVGGLASSPYVYAELQKWGTENGVSVSRPDGPTSKAVANGALAWHVDSSVGARVSKYFYGTNCSIGYDSDNKDHKERTPYIDEDGEQLVQWAWSGILVKGVKVEAGKEFTSSYTSNFALDRKDFEHTADIYVYRKIKPPTFVTFPGKTKLYPGYDQLCTVKANLEDCFKATPVSISVQGKRYKMLHFDVCLSLGETEVTARLRWEHNGKQEYGPASVAWD